MFSMGNTRLSERHAENIAASIAANETTSGAIDLRGYVILGLIATSAMISGNLAFQVSDALDGTYVDVEDSSGSAVSLGAFSGTFALKADDLAFLAPYRYLKIVSSVAQTNGVSFILPVKA